MMQIGGIRVTGGEMATTSSKKRGRNHPCEAVFTAPHLPHEVIVEIISRLPVKSICRFRCVSKLWLSTTSCPKFAKTHLDLAFRNNTQKQILFSGAGGTVCSIDWESINADDVISKGVVAVELDGSLKDYPDWFSFRDNIMCSSNGLICIEVIDNAEESFLVINPCTGESREIPLGSLKYDTWCDIVHGFGYASKSDDYKLVRINGENMGMYSLRSGTWSKCTAPGMPYEFFCSAAYGVPLNGALHWLGTRTLSGEDKCVVVCFDLNENTIREMPPPVDDYDTVGYLTLGVVNGCLCAYDREAFWVMREYNNGESWTKISSISVPLNTLGLAKKRVNQTVVLSNFENATHGITIGGFDIGTYVESLISPNHYVGN